MLEDYEEGKGRGKLGPAPQPGRGLERGSSPLGRDQP